MYRFHDVASGVKRGAGNAAQRKRRLRHAGVGLAALPILLALLPSPAAGQIEYVKIVEWDIPSIGAGAGSLIIDRRTPNELDIVYFAEATVSQLGILDTNTGQIIEKPFLTPNSGPQGLAMGPDGSVDVCLGDANEIAVYSPSQGAFLDSIIIPTPNSIPTDIVWLDSTHIAVTKPGANQVGIYDTLTKKWLDLTLPIPNSWPLGLAIAPNGEVFGTLLQGNGFFKLSTNPPQLTVIPTANANLGYPAFGPDNLFYVPYLSADKVEVWSDYKLVKYYLTPTKSSEPTAVAYAGGSIWGTEQIGNNLFQIDPSTDKIVEYPFPQPGSGPADIRAANLANMATPASLKTGPEVGTSAAASVVTAVLYVTENTGNRIAQITVSEPVAGATATATSSPTPITSPTASASATATPAPCAGDCNGDSHVTVDEILTMVQIALGNALVSTCAAGDVNHVGLITIDMILAAVSNALNGCAFIPPTLPPTRTRTVTATATQISTPVPTSTLRPTATGSPTTTQTPASTCTATLSSPANGASISFPYTFSWSTAGSCTNLSFAFATSASPSTVATLAVSGSSTTISAAQWSQVKSLIGTGSTYYWAVGESIGGVFNARTSFNSFTTTS